MRRMSHSISTQPLMGNWKSISPIFLTFFVLNHPHSSTKYFVFSDLRLLNYRIFKFQLWGRSVITFLFLKTQRRKAIDKCYRSCFMFFEPYSTTCVSYYSLFDDFFGFSTETTPLKANLPGQNLISQKII